MKPGKEKRMDEMLNYHLKPHFRYYILTAYSPNLAGQTHISTFRWQEERLTLWEQGESLGNFYHHNTQHRRLYQEN